MATTTLMLMTTPTIGRVVQSNQLTIMLVVVHCVEEAVREKKRKRTVKINWLRVRRLGGYKKKCFQRGTCLWGVHVYGLYGSTVVKKAAQHATQRTAQHGEDAPPPISLYQLKIVEYVYGKSSKIIPLRLCISHLKTFPLSDLNGFKTSGFSMFFYII